MRSFDTKGEGEQPVVGNGKGKWEFVLNFRTASRGTPLGIYDGKSKRESGMARRGGGSKNASEQVEVGWVASNREGGWRDMAMLLPGGLARAASMVCGRNGSPVVLSRWNHRPRYHSLHGLSCNDTLPRAPTPPHDLAQVPH